MEEPGIIEQGSLTPEGRYFAHALELWSVITDAQLRSDVSETSQHLPLCNDQGEPVNFVTKLDEGNKSMIQSLISLLPEADPNNATVETWPFMGADVWRVDVGRGMKLEVQTTWGDQDKDLEPSVTLWLSTAWV